MKLVCIHQITINLRTLTGALTLMKDAKGRLPGCFDERTEL